jgi:FtsP/CotA-like multicopper oxidase with cupredoxin domain
MYFNVFGEKVSKAQHKQMCDAAENRRQIVAAGLTRRDMVKAGLLTSAGYLVAKKGLSARWGSMLPVVQAASPPVKPFVQAMPIMPVKQTVPFLLPAPQVVPNTAAGEARTRNSQGLVQFPPKNLYAMSDLPSVAIMSPSLPPQYIWGFDGISPGPTFVGHYGVPDLVRQFNFLPPVQDNGGFGNPSITTHLHNGHTPSESDGFACDYFSAFGQSPLYWYDQHYPNVLAGFSSTNPPNGDINESLSTLWYHDHRIGFTAQNTYKGLIGYHLLFNAFDTGNETTGFRIPSFPQFDIPMVLSDKVFDPTTGLMFFDLFNIDGILGDTFLVNGVVQPTLSVEPRKYRFRLLDVGPSRFYDLFLTGLPKHGSPTTNPFWVIANDGNLLPKPIQVTDVEIGVASRMDVIMDFTNFAGQTLYIENRLQQLLGRGPLDPETILPAGTGNLLLQINVGGTQGVNDQSGNPATMKFYPLPTTTQAPAVTRVFEFDRLQGQWSINSQFAECETPRFTVTQNTAEHWVFKNLSGDWQHPIHIHLEEYQILSRNGVPPSGIEVARKDVIILHQNEVVELFFRFRDWTGRYPLHCHNVVHEDNAMLLRWDIEPEGDTNRTP